MNATINKVLELEAKISVWKIILSLMTLEIKALKRIELIKNSKAINYELAGGYFERQRDLIKAEKALVWIEENTIRLKRTIEEA